jgi:predicted nucleic acid-binding protein
MSRALKYSRERSTSRDPAGYDGAVRAAQSQAKYRRGQLLESASTRDRFLSALTIGEIQAGIEKQRKVAPDTPEFAEALSQWLTLIELQFAQSILPVSPAIAKLWGRLSVQTGDKGIDNLIAATAMVHNLLLVTRNVKDFEVKGVRVFDPCMGA